MPRTCSRTGNVVLRCVALVTIALVFNIPLSAQTATVPTSTVLKRIAEAVDSKGNGETVFVVVNRNSATVAETVTSQPQAEAIRKRLGAAYDIYGPYKAKIDLGPLGDRVPDDCVHDGNTSNMLGPICDTGLIHRSEISAMSLVLKFRNGTSRTIVLPISTDALFLSYQAYDKFVFPYYERVLGLEATSAMRERMLARGRTRR